MSLAVSRNSCESSVHHIMAKWNVLRDAIAINNSPRTTINLTALIHDEVQHMQLDIVIEEETRLVLSLHKMTVISQEQEAEEDEKRKEKVRIVGMVNVEESSFSSQFIDVAEIDSKKCVTVQCKFPEDPETVSIQFDLTLFFGDAAFQ